MQRGRLGFDDFFFGFRLGLGLDDGAGVPLVSPEEAGRCVVVAVDDVDDMLVKYQPDS